MQTKLPFRRLPLAGACNVRDLGGHPCEGGMTRWGVFLRSDGPNNLSQQDINYLLNFGLTDVVDLRRERECEEYPSKLIDVTGVNTHNVPMGDKMNEVNFEGELPGSMSGLYVEMLSSKQKEFCAAFKALANAKGVAMFHCAVGKDRTGMLSMLLLGLVGVSDEDIIADYVLSEIYLKKAFSEKLAAVIDDIPEFVRRSHPESMELALEYLYEKHGTVAEYLQRAGVSAEHIIKVKEKLIEKI